MEPKNDIQLERWRLILGGGPADGTSCSLSGEMQQVDAALTALYDFDRKQRFDYDADKEKGKGGTEGSNPGVARWLGDIRKYFPVSVVNVLQNDAMRHPELKKKMIFEPEILEKAEADVHLVATLMELGKLIPSKTKDTARRVVQKVVDELMQKLEQKTINALVGALNRSTRNLRPKHNEMNWDATIRKNLKHYQPDYKTIIPEVRIGYGRKTRKSLKDIILCLDQSGSMGTSVVYSGIFGAVMASLPNVRTRMVVFDTAVADLTEELKDPVDLLFGVQLGGGTDINLALQYCQEQVTRPDDTILVLVTDLYEGGNEQEMHKRAKELVDSGVQVICLLALNDQGSPAYDANNATQFSKHGIPVFACTPDMFPDLMAAAIKKQDLRQWAGDRDIVVR
ncbi:VWA domain-containing protein [Chryseolinea lacunae]|uniref:VWA domain-containing protein n=1 Tax=Chryseolinea lacunae TaxID=2801331 RepID=A0ABS1KWU2_9BACT|nr:VWA domain-containing protein [Chryseolinea lacunae]MBL0743682.1 VWA domain-containing protein [Chryseolinea lacunae]